MSYLIQNFYRYHYSVRMTWRLHTAFLARNFASIYVLLSSSSKAFNLLRTGVSLTRPLSKLGEQSFRRLVVAALPRAKEIKHSPIGINFARSAHYVSLVEMDRMSNPSYKIRTFLPLSTHFITYPYFFGLPIIFTPVAKSQFLEVLYRFLRTSFAVWVRWPGKFKITSHYTNVYTELRLITFLNSYFIKVFNI